MRRTIKVFLGDQSTLVGTIRYDIQGTRESTAFEYDMAWLSSKMCFPIDPALPLVRGPQFHRKVQTGSVFNLAIADTEPDGWAKRVILRSSAKQRQQLKKSGDRVEKTGALNAVDFLLAVDDFARAGALRFQDEEGVFQHQPKEGRRTAPPLIELKNLIAASRAIEEGNETAFDLEYLRGRGTSLGGLRPKCNVVDDAGNLMIAKFPSIGDERAVTKGEVLALKLALRAGINAADAQLVHSAGVPVTLVRRFDRLSVGRIMYVSAATMLGAESAATEHSYTEIVDVLRTKGAAPQADIEELWRRIAFSILITNTDDHLHNHGFLHVAHDQWRLAPAFDLNPFPDRVRELKTWISEETGPVASIESLMSVISYFRIGLSRAKTILNEIETAVSHWRDEGHALGMTDKELDMFQDAFEHPERKTAQHVIGSSL